MNHSVLSFYRFVEVPDVEALQAAIREACVRHDARGRIYVAAEGVNATICVPCDQHDALVVALNALDALRDVHIKVETVDRQVFEKLRVRLRPHLVNMGEATHLDPHESGGQRLSPEQWREWLASDRDYLLLDVRNDYEGLIGRFRGAVVPPYATFAEFPQWARELGEGEARKPVLMYCTGGIRCEKFSGLLMQHGFDEVYQLDGGILHYVERCGGEHFEGECFVFDDRVSIDVGGAPDTRARCAHCGEPTPRYRNCANVDCHKLFLCCDACALEHRGVCQAACLEAPRLRPVAGEHLRRPWRGVGTELGGAGVRFRAVRGAVTP